MATFIGGIGEIGLGYDIGGIAQDNGCFEGTRGVQVSMWEQWNLVYYMFPYYNAPYNFGFFYGQGCPAQLRSYLNFYADPYSEDTGAFSYFYSIGTDYEIDALSNYNQVCNQGPVTYIPTKNVGQSTATVYMGVRSTAKSPASVNYDADTITCPDTANNTYGGTLDYPSSCAGQATVSVSSATVSDIFLTVAVNKSGFFVTC